MSVEEGKSRSKGRKGAVKDKAVIELVLNSVEIIPSADGKSKVKKAQAMITLDSEGGTEFQPDSELEASLALAASTSVKSSGSVNADAASSAKKPASSIKEAKTVSSSSSRSTEVTGKPPRPKVLSPSKLRFMMVQKESELSMNKGSSSSKSVNGRSKQSVKDPAPEHAEGGGGNSSAEFHISDTSASPSFLAGTQEPEVDTSRVVKMAKRRGKEKAVSQPKVVESDASAGPAVREDIIVFTGVSSKNPAPAVTVEPVVKSKRLRAKKAALADAVIKEVDEPTPNDLNLSQDIAEGPVVPAKRKKMVPSWYLPSSPKGKTNSTKPEENPVKGDSPAKVINNSAINTEPVLTPSTSKGKKVLAMANSESVLLAKRIKGRTRAPDEETLIVGVEAKGLEEDESLLIQQLKGYNNRTTRSQSKMGQAVLPPAAPPSPRSRTKPDSIRTATEPSALVVGVDKVKEKIGSKQKANSEPLLNINSTKTKALVVIPEEKGGKHVGVAEKENSSASAVLEVPSDEYDTAEEEDIDDHDHEGESEKGEIDNDVTLKSKEGEVIGATDNDAEVGPEFEDANDVTLHENDGQEEPLSDIKLEIVKDEDESMVESPKSASYSSPSLPVPESFNFARLSVSNSEMSRSQDLFETQSNGETTEEVQSREESLTPEKVLQETTNLPPGSTGSEGESGLKVADQEEGMEISPGEPLVKGILKRRNSERLSLESNIPRKKLCFSQVTEIYNLDPIVREVHQALSSPLVVKKISPIRRNPFPYNRSRTQRNNVKASSLFSFTCGGNPWNPGKLPPLNEKDPFYTSTPIPSRGREMLELSLAANLSSKPPKGPSGGADDPILGSCSPVVEFLDGKSLKDASLSADKSGSSSAYADAGIQIAEGSLRNEEVGKQPELTDSYRYCMDMDVLKEPDSVAKEAELGVESSKDDPVASHSNLGGGKNDISHNAVDNKSQNAAGLDAEPVVHDLNAAAGNCGATKDIGEEKMDVQTSLEQECLKEPVISNRDVVTEMEEDSEINLSGIVDPATTFQDSLSFSSAKFYTLAYPRLANCQEPVELVLLRLTSNASVDLLERALKTKKITTIGDLCSITKFQIQQLPIRSPRFQTFEKAMQEVEKGFGSFGGTDTSANNVADKQAANPDDNGSSKAHQDDEFSASFQNGQNPFEGSLGIVGTLLGTSTQPSQTSSSLKSDSQKNSERLEKEDESVKDKVVKSLKENLPSSDRDFEWSEGFSGGDSPKKTPVTITIQADAPIPSSPVLTKALFNDFNFLNELKEQLASDSVESRRLIQFIVADKQVAAALLQPLLAREDLLHGLGANTSRQLVSAVTNGYVSEATKGRWIRSSPPGFWETILCNLEQRFEEESDPVSLLKLCDDLLKMVKPKTSLDSGKSQIMENIVADLNKLQALDSAEKEKVLSCGTSTPEKPADKSELVEALKSASVHHLSVEDKKDLIHALINSFGSG